jgi:DNA-binding CsgD family transcriptional regulator
VSRRKPRLVPRALEATVLGDGAVVLSYSLAPSSLPGLARLTPSEREVVALALEGFDGVAIARATGRSHHTVSNLLRRAYRRFGVSSRASLAAALVRASSRV